MLLLSLCNDLLCSEVHSFRSSVSLCRKPKTCKEASKEQSPQCNKLGVYHAHATYMWAMHVGSQFLVVPLLRQKRKEPNQINLELRAEHYIPAKHCVCYFIWIVFYFFSKIELYRFFSSFLLLQIIDIFPLRMHRCTMLVCSLYTCMTQLFCFFFFWADDSTIFSRTPKINFEYEKKLLFQYIWTMTLAVRILPNACTQELDEEQNCGLWSVEVEKCQNAGKLKLQLHACSHQQKGSTCCE